MDYFNIERSGADSANRPAKIINSRIKLSEFQTAAFEFFEKKGEHKKRFSLPQWRAIIVIALSGIGKSHLSGKYASHRTPIKITSIKKWTPELYRKYLLGTTEDRIAEAALRILDLASLVHVNLLDTPLMLFRYSPYLKAVEKCRSLSFLEMVMLMTNDILSNNDIQSLVFEDLAVLIAIAESKFINLEWIIPIKLANDTSKNMN